MESVQASILALSNDPASRTSRTDPEEPFFNIQNSFARLLPAQRTQAIDKLFTDWSISRLIETETRRSTVVGLIWKWPFLI